MSAFFEMESYDDMFDNEVLDERGFPVPTGNGIEELMIPQAPSESIDSPRFTPRSASGEGSDGEDGMDIDDPSPLESPNISASTTIPLQSGDATEITSNDGVPTFSWVKAIFLTNTGPSLSTSASQLINSVDRRIASLMPQFLDTLAKQMKLIVSDGLTTRDVRLMVDRGLKRLSDRRPNTYTGTTTFDMANVAWDGGSLQTQPGFILFKRGKQIERDCTYFNKKRGLREPRVRCKTLGGKGNNEYGFVGVDSRCIEFYFEIKSMGFDLPKFLSVTTRFGPLDGPRRNFRCCLLYSDPRPWRHRRSSAQSFLAETSGRPSKNK